MFSPPPKVDSAIVHIEIAPASEEISQGLIEFVKNSFAMRRKTLLNNLSKAYGIEKELLQEKLSGFDLSRRAETFSVQDYINMFAAFQK